MKKLWKMLGMFSFVLIVSVLAGMTTYAESYNGSSAADWALANVTNYAGGSNCAKFVRASMRSGGLSIPDSVSGAPVSGTTYVCALRRALLNTNCFAEYQLTYNIENSWEWQIYANNSSNKGHISVGDAVFWSEKNSQAELDAERMPHIAIVTEIESNGRVLLTDASFGNSGYRRNGNYVSGSGKSVTNSCGGNSVKSVWVLHYTSDGTSCTPPPTPSSCGCSEANAGYYKVTATDGLSVNSGHNFNSKCGELSYGQVVKVSKASGTGGVSGTYGHIVYNGKECYIAMKYMTRASDSEVCAAVGHNQQTIPGKAASCTASGLTDGVRCTRCGATITSQQTIPAMGHTFGSWRDKSAATCTAQATHVAVCGRCGSEYGSVTPYGDYVQHIQDPNNKEYCKVCGQKCFEEEVQEGVSAWTKADEAPDGVEIVNRKWSYTKREYTTSSNSELPGWVQYKTTSAWNDYGGWSDWQNSAVSGSDSRQVETRWIEPVTQHRYNYYRYINSAHNYYATTKGYNGCNTLEELSLTSPLTLKSTSGGVEAYGTAQCNESASGAHSAHQRNSWLKDSVRNRAFETDVVISPGYTQYRYRDRSLSYTYYYYKDSSMDSETKPSGEDISNVIEWVKYKTNICVTFNAAGGSSPIASKNVTLGDTYGELPTPTRAGYTFAGWYTEAAGGTQVTDKTPVNGAANHTLYAHWEAISYKVSFDANEGTVSVAEKSVLFGSAYGELPTPTRGGYDFLGWYNDRENGVAVTNETVVDTAADHTLYAQWEKQDPCAAGHTFGRWAEKTSATCTTQATHMAVCSVCDQEYGDFVPYGDLAPHTYGEWTVVREATVEETGLKRRTCTVCGHDEEQEIEKLPPVVDENAPQIVMGTATGRAGNTVDVTISLKNNPGVASVLITVGYDMNAMTLTDVTDAGILGDMVIDRSQMGNSPYTISWEGDNLKENCTADGTIATLTFTVKEGVAEGSYPLTVNYDESQYGIMDTEGNSLHLDIVNGGITVRNVVLGDVDGDGNITPHDRMVLSRYLAKWNGYDTQIDLAAADVDADGSVTPHDRMVLSRYLAKWKGYTTLPYKK